MSTQVGRAPQEETGFAAGTNLWKCGSPDYFLSLCGEKPMMCTAHVRVCGTEIRYHVVSSQLNTARTEIAARNFLLKIQHPFV